MSDDTQDLLKALFPKPIRLRYVTHESPKHEPMENMTIGAFYDVTVLRLADEEVLNELEVTNDSNERIRILQGHFMEPKPSTQINPGCPEKKR